MTSTDYWFLQLPFKCDNGYVNVASEHKVPLPDPERVSPSDIRFMFFLRWSSGGFLPTAGYINMSKQQSVTAPGETETKARFYRAREILN